MFSSAGIASAASLTQAESSLLKVVNRARAAHGLGPLHADATLERAARAHSSDMLQHGYFAHGAFAQRMRAFAARGPVTGENLAWGAGGFAAAANVVREWLASPGHRANLLRPGFRRIGIGALRGAFHGYGDALVVTADFGGR